MSPAIAMRSAWLPLLAAIVLGLVGCQSAPKKDLAL